MPEASEGGHEDMLQGDNVTNFLVENEFCRQHSRDAALVDSRCDYSGFSFDMHVCDTPFVLCTVGEGCVCLPQRDGGERSERASEGRERASGGGTGGWGEEREPGAYWHGRCSAAGSSAAGRQVSCMTDLLCLLRPPTKDHIPIHTYMYTSTSYTISAGRLEGNFPFALWISSPCWPKCMRKCHNFDKSI